MPTNIVGEEFLAIFFYQLLDLLQFRVPESIIARQGDRREPKLGLEVIALHMDVRWLAKFPAIEVESIRANAKHCGHALILRSGNKVSTSSRLL
jgi:hypothetical protein